MSLCINPRCAEPDHPGNDSSRFCQSCGSDLILQSRYRVLRLISDKSGFGRVYEAYERSTPKILKVLKEVFNHNDKAVELFQQEALVLGQLHHPGIPMIEPNGYFQFAPRNGTDSLHCIVMEKIDGPNLREWMRQQGNNPIGERQALDWLKQIVEVLHLVHQKNYFHRDIKPENIMLRSNGQLVLVDFGAAREMTYSYLAQLSDGQDSPTGITRISSAGYTPPEQELGQAVPQSDFYALGRTFIYLLTGKSPTDANIYDPMQNEFRWRNYAPGISSSLGDLVDKLTSPRVSDRPRNTQEILDILARLRQDFVTNRAIPVLPLPATEVKPETVQQSSLLHPPQKRLSRPLIIGALMALTALAGGYVVWQRVLIDPPGTAAAERSLTLLKTLNGHQGNVNTLYLSPGEQTLVSGSSDNTLKVWDLHSGTLLRTLAGHSSFVNTVVVSPDGSTVVSGSADKTLKLWSLQTGQLLKIVVGHTSFINSVLVSHNGQLMISGSADGEIKVWDFQSGQVRQTLTGHSGAVNALVMSRDGQTLISGSADGEIKLWDLATGQQRLAIASSGSPVNALLISLDGHSIIAGYADASIKQWDSQTGHLVQTLSGHTAAVNVLVLRDDGHTLYSGSADQTVRVWDLRTGKTVQVLTGFDTYVNELAITSDNLLITNSRGSGIRIWQLSASATP